MAASTGIPKAPPQARRSIRLQWIIVTVLVGLMILTFATLDIASWARVWRGIRTSFWPVVSGFLRPSGDVLMLALGGMLETIYMAVLGTIIGAVLAFPLSFFASANLLGGKRYAFPGKSLLVAIRTFPEILLAIIFVAAIGPGALAGIMALGIHSIGFLGKIFADVIEGIDPGPNEAIRATGGTSLHVFLYSVVPQVLPEFLSNVLYRFEINLRAATILGLVGAGGIGLSLIQRIQFRYWNEVSTFLIVIVVVIIVVDSCSSFIRRRLV